jgi:hypothetical protein
MKYFKLVFALWWLACTPLAMAMYFDQAFRHLLRQRL